MRSHLELVNFANVFVLLGEDLTVVHVFAGLVRPALLVVHDAAAFRDARLSLLDVWLVLKNNIKTDDVPVHVQVVHTAPLQNLLFRLPLA